MFPRVVVLLFLYISLVATAQEDPHPYGYQIDVHQRVWNAINHPRLERNFCCCYCRSNPEAEPKWNVREDMETYCGYEYCQLMFSDTCKDHTSIMYAGATGLHDPYNDGIQVSDMYSPANQRILAQQQQQQLKTAQGAKATGSSPPTPQRFVPRLTMGAIHNRCNAVMQEGSAWWGEFQGMTAMEQWS